MSDSVTLPDGRSVDSLKVVELKKELEARGLDKNGLKKDLVSRLSRSLSGLDASLATSDSDQSSLQVPSTIEHGDDGNKSVDTSVANAESTPAKDTNHAVPEAQPETEVSKEVADEKLPRGNVDLDVQPEANDGETSASHSVESVAVDAMAKDAPAEKAEAPVEAAEAMKAPSSHEAVISPSVLEVNVEEEDYGDEEEEEEGEEEDEEEKAASSATKTTSTAPASKPSKVTPEKASPVSSSTGVKSTEQKPVSMESPIPQKKETRVVGFTVEAPERVNPAVAAKCAVTSMVYITCLVRPFTATQLSTMLETHFGKPVELWLDRIKSSAVARFADEATATKCREGLDGCRWPSINPRVLQVDYATKALLSWLKEFGEAGDKAPPRYLVLGGTPASASKAPEKPLAESGKGNVEAVGKRDRRGEPNEPARKLGSNGSTKRNASGTGEERVRSLDELFKKTQATPSVYWLPLSEEAATAQMKARQRSYQPESGRRPVPKRGGDERARENRSPFTGEFKNGSAMAGASNPLAPDDHSSGLLEAPRRDKRPRERTPSPGAVMGRRGARERHSPSPRRPRYGHGDRTYASPPPPPPPPPRIDRSSAGRRRVSPSPRYRRRSPPRR